MRRFEGYDGEETPVVQTTTLGYPRIGRDRELKRACESYWAGTQGEDALRATGATLRRAQWAAQRAAGIALIPVNDVSLYDHALEAIARVGAGRARYRCHGDLVDWS